MHDFMSNLLANVKKAGYVSEFKKIDYKTVRKMNEMELAEWQAKFPSDSPQFILAGHEWLRRLTRDQNRASLCGAVIGAITALGCILIGFFLQ